MYVQSSYKHISVKHEPATRHDKAWLALLGISTSVVESHLHNTTKLSRDLA